MITITRSFARTVQVKQYEPANFFCSATEEVMDSSEPNEKQKVSEKLYKFCKEEVERNIREYVDMNQKADSEEGPY